MNYIGGNWEKGLGATYASINPEMKLFCGKEIMHPKIKSSQQ